MPSGTLLTIAFFCVFWGIFGLIWPGSLFFARPEVKTKYNAFYFPVTCAVFFLLCHFVSSGGLSPIVAGVAGLFPFLYFLVLCGVGLRKNTPTLQNKVRHASRTSTFDSQKKNRQAD